MDNVEERIDGESIRPQRKPSTFIATRQSGRQRRRKLACFLAVFGYFVLLGFMMTSGKSSIETKLERSAAKQFAAEEFAGIRAAASGRNVRLTGTVATQTTAENARKLLLGTKLVRDVDISQLKIGSAAGGVLPFTATYAEGSVTFGGTRPGEQALGELLRAAKRGLGDENVKEAFGDASPGGAPEAYARIGEAIARFRDLQVRTATVRVAQDSVELTGRLAAEASRAEIVQSFSAATGYAVTDSLTAEAAVVTDGPTTLASTPQTTGGTTAQASATVTVGVSSETVAGEALVTSTLPVGAAPTVEQKAALQLEIAATLKSNSIQFATDSATLSSASLQIIADVAARLQAFDVAFEVGGHTDSRGNAEKNTALSQRRADAVRAEFIRLGIPADNVTAVGFGSTKTIAADDSSRGNPVNRRIEISLK
jgi:outer membrane protein OmpA-like peptidoglycan-associated protein